MDRVGDGRSKSYSTRTRPGNTCRKSRLVASRASGEGDCQCRASVSVVRPFQAPQGGSPIIRTRRACVRRFSWIGHAPRRPIRPRVSDRPEHTGPPSGRDARGRRPSVHTRCMPGRLSPWRRPPGFPRPGPGYLNREMRRSRPRLLLAYRPATFPGSPAAARPQVGPGRDPLQGRPVRTI